MNSSLLLLSSLPFVSSFSSHPNPSLLFSSRISSHLFPSSPPSPLISTLLRLLLLLSSLTLTQPQFLSSFLFSFRVTSEIVIDDDAGVPADEADGRDDDDEDTVQPITPPAKRKRVYPKKRVPDDEEIIEMYQRQFAQNCGCDGMGDWSRFGLGFLKLQKQPKITTLKCIECGVQMKRVLWDKD